MPNTVHFCAGSAADVEIAQTPALHLLNVL